ncbi:MAG: phosphatidate cytidylyltransferase [Gemmatimonadetes bacterium]|nr:phosphatidate cytidylyltransferase [Gemmatimonadota bacterium]MBI3567144.1 phosphatidate cytidylyltransferase [Gemmatimonadota bacterium]
MSDFPKRLAFAVVAAPAVVALVWLGGAWLAVLLSVASGLAAHEFFALSRDTGSRPLHAHGVTLAALVPLLVHARTLGLWVPPVSLLMLVVLELLVAALFARGSAGKPLEAVGLTLLGVFYTGGMLAFAYGLRYHPYVIGAGAGTALVAFPLLLTWGTDTGAYAVGRWLGVRKLMPTVSPGKTVAGAVGGLLAAVVIGVIYARVALPSWAMVTLRLPVAIGVGALLSVAAQLGDLVESMFKREVGVKDSSHLIPGHGGMLDRVDSLLFTLPLGYVLLSWLLVPAPR